MRSGSNAIGRASKMRTENWVKEPPFFWCSLNKLRIIKSRLKTFPKEESFSCVGISGLHITMIKEGSGYKQRFGRFTEIS